MSHRTKIFRGRPPASAMNLNLSSTALAAHLTWHRARPRCPSPSQGLRKAQGRRRPAHPQAPSPSAPGARSPSQACQCPPGPGPAQSASRPSPARHEARPRGRSGGSARSRRPVVVPEDPGRANLPAPAAPRPATTGIIRMTAVPLAASGPWPMPVARAGLPISVRHVPLRCFVH
jgi:hypothetical protein